MYVVYEISSLMFTKNGTLGVVSKSGVYVVYKKWYVRGLQKMVCLWFTQKGINFWPRY